MVEAGAGGAIPQLSVSGSRQGLSFMDVLNLPRPAWMTEDVVLLEEQARRFFAAEFVPHLEQWNQDGIMDRAMWGKAGEAGLLCASLPPADGGGRGPLPPAGRVQPRDWPPRARLLRPPPPFRPR